MDIVEKDARKDHGAFMYNLIWKARSTDKKWLWGAVALVVLLDLVWRSVLLVNFVYFCLLSVRLIVGWTENVYFWKALLHASLLGIVLSPVANAMFFKSSALQVTSNSIAIAGDMIRIISERGNIFGKVFAKLIYFFFGAIAVVSARLVFYYCYTNEHPSGLDNLKMTELDVLGNALSNGKIFWDQAETVYVAIGNRYLARNMHNKAVYRQITISYGMACMWMLKHPKMSKMVPIYKEKIRETMREFPDLPSTVTLRFYVALEDKEGERRAKEKIVAQVS